MSLRKAMKELKVKEKGIIYFLVMNYLFSQIFRYSLCLINVFTEFFQPNCYNSEYELNKWNSYNQFVSISAQS